ncbi:phage head maturation protease [Sphingomonas desiccabilis]|nr:phage head maturation protease [Sphingomonas desiccabilis]
MRDWFGTVRWAGCRSDIACRRRGHGRWRELERLDLVEVSLVAVPMQPLARVHAVAPG